MDIIGKICIFLKVHLITTFLGDDRYWLTEKQKIPNINNMHYNYAKYAFTRNQLIELLAFYMMCGRMGLGVDIRRALKGLTWVQVVG